MASPTEERRQQSGPFTLPSIAAMTQGMPQDKSPTKHSSGDQMRDSGMWSMQSQSKHSSTISSATGFSAASSSNNGLQLHSILNSEDASSNRYSTASLASHNSGRLSSSQHPLPALNRSYTSDNNPRASIDANNTFFIDSRRSSIDSRSNVTLDNLAINNSPPFDSRAPSHRASESSLASSYRDSRTSNPPTSAPRSNGVFTTPATRRPITSSGQPPRRAPVIQPNPRSSGMPNPTASTPTRGYAWAFPDTLEEEKEGTSPEVSRQPSITASSINTIDSGFPGSKSLSNLSDPTITAGNYSRTPELRVSHKLAERKRRSEMKDLFDGLNRILPNSPGNKSSKWEVLTKSVEYIAGLKDAYAQGQRENEKLRSELEQARSTAEDNQSLNNEILVMFEHICRLDPTGHKAFGPRTQQLMQQEQQRQSQHPAHRQPYAPMEGVSYGQYDRR